MKKPLKDSFRFLGSETNKHIDLKFYTCKLLKKQGYSFYTEVTLINNLRPDILVPSLGCVFEIVSTESDESIEKKKVGYLGLRVYPVRCKKDIEQYLGV